MGIHTGQYKSTGGYLQRPGVDFFPHRILEKTLYQVIIMFLNLMFDNTCRTDHTCHKLWTEICKATQMFKWDLIKFCEIFTKITLKLPPNSQKPLL